MKVINNFIIVVAFLSIGIKTIAQAASNTQKTVLLINAHLTYPGLSEGKLNKAFL